jgi:hypothetical protein
LKARAWFQRFYFLRRPVSAPETTVSATASGSSSSIRSYATHGPGDNPSVESRIAAIEQNTESLHRRITQTQNEMDAESRRLSGLMTNESNIRHLSVNAMQQNLERAETGGLHISAIGAALLFVGVTLSTASPEISKFFQ